MKNIGSFLLVLHSIRQLCLVCLNLNRATQMRRPQRSELPPLPCRSGCRISKRTTSSSLGSRPVLTEPHPSRAISLRGKKKERRNATQPSATKVDRHRKMTFGDSNSRPAHIVTHRSGKNCSPVSLFQGYAYIQLDGIICYRTTERNVESMSRTMKRIATCFFFF